MRRSAHTFRLIFLKKQGCLLRFFSNILISIIFLVSPLTVWADVLPLGIHVGTVYTASDGHNYEAVAVRKDETGTSSAYCDESGCYNTLTDFYNAYVAGNDIYLRVRNRNGYYVLDYWRIVSVSPDLNDYVINDLSFWVKQTDKPSDFVLPDYDVLSASFINQSFSYNSGGPVVSSPPPESSVNPLPPSNPSGGSSPLDPLFAPVASNDLVINIGLVLGGAVLAVTGFAAYNYVSRGLKL